MRGIYLIENLVNGHSYVGQSVNIKNRWAYHRATTYCENKTEYNYPLYRAFRKYGLDNFDFVILEEVNDMSDLTEKEKYWFDVIEPEYNVIKPRTPQQARSKPVYQIDKETLKVIAEFPSATEAGRVLSTDGASISSVARGVKNKKSAGGYYWKYVEDYDENWKPIDTVRKDTKRVLQIDSKTFEPIKVYDSVQQAARETNTHVAAISAVCNGRGLTAGGYIWTFIP